MRSPKREIMRNVQFGQSRRAQPSSSSKFGTPITNIKCATYLASLFPQIKDEIALWSVFEFENVIPSLLFSFSRCWLSQ